MIPWYIESLDGKYRDYLFDMGEAERYKAECETPCFITRGVKKRMHSTKDATMITLFFSMSQGKNHCTLSSVRTLRKNLSKFHSIKIKRRWMFQCLADLTSEGYIRRKERYSHDPNGLVTQRPSVVWFTLHGIAWLVKMGVKGAGSVYKSMITYLKKGDGRSPTREEFDDGSWKPKDPAERARLDGLLGIVTKRIN